MKDTFELSMVDYNGVEIPQNTVLVEKVVAISSVFAGRGGQNYAFKVYLSGRDAPMYSWYIYMGEAEDKRSALESLMIVQDVSV